MHSATLPLQFRAPVSGAVRMRPARRLRCNAAVLEVPAEFTKVRPQAAGQRRGERVPWRRQPGELPTLFPRPTEPPCFSPQITPIGDRVCVKVAVAETKTAGGILLPSEAQRKPTSGVPPPPTGLPGWHRLPPCLH